MPNNTAEENARLANIEHIVVVVMENRSFDHMLGYLSLPVVKGGKGRTAGPGKVDGLTGGERNPDDEGNGVPVGPCSAYKRVKNTGAILKDPPHEWTAVHRQMDRRWKTGFTPALGESWAMDGFVDQFQEKHPDVPKGLVMAYFTGEDLPVYDFLAEHYGVCDRWFCSLPNWTMPNKLMMIGGRCDVDVAKGEGVAGGAKAYASMTGKSLFQLLDEQQVPWRAYYQDQSHVGLQYFGLGAYFEELSSNPHFVGCDTDLAPFAADCAQGRLAPVTWVEPNFVVLGSKGEGRTANDDHAPASVRAGQRFVERVYRALANSPKEKWESTLLLVVYDEHGGFYDHVPPPATGEKAPFDWLGVRVPALVAGPRVAPGSVCHEPLDHTAVFATILARFCPGAKLAKLPRLARAKHLGCALSDAVHPDPALPAEIAPAAWDQAPSAHAPNEAALPAHLKLFSLATKG
ncbi:MAG: alkaline phosphatase family protein [Pseudomonadota bacterium]|nr:alkaline phosphatase family protein [Pseudomonadota bacterium]